jgi:hypothetical protein
MTDRHGGEPISFPIIQMPWPFTRSNPLGRDGLTGLFT